MPSVVCPAAALRAWAVSAALSSRRGLLIESNDYDGCNDVGDDFLVFSACPVNFFLFISFVFSSPYSLPICASSFSLSADSDSFSLCLFSRHCYSCASTRLSWLATWLNLPVFLCFHLIIVANIFCCLFSDQFRARKLRCPDDVTASHGPCWTAEQFAGAKREREREREGKRGEKCD